MSIEIAAVMKNACDFETGSFDAIKDEVPGVFHGLSFYALAA